MRLAKPAQNRASIPVRLHADLQAHLESLAGPDTPEGYVMPSLVGLESGGQRGPIRPFHPLMHLAQQPRQSLHAVYQGWIERFVAHAAAQWTGVFNPAPDATAAVRRRVALADHQRLCREITLLRASARKETQLHRRVELNLELKRLESCLAEAQEAL